VTLQWPVLFRDAAAGLRAHARSELRVFHWKSTGYMAKAWYGNPSLHYELWVRGQRRIVELGLHFEADPLTNARLLAAFRARAAAVARAIGDDARIEEWDKGWARIWEPISLELPDAEVRERVVTRFVAYVRALEPILRDELPADVEWELPAGRGRAGRRATSSRASRSARR